MIRKRIVASRSVDDVSPAFLTVGNASLIDPRRMINFRGTRTKPGIDHLCVNHSKQVLRKAERLGLLLAPDDFEHLALDRDFTGSEAIGDPFFRKK